MPKFSIGRLHARSWLLSALLLVSACQTAFSQAAGVSDKEIKLGGVLALSGPVTLVTTPYRQAIEAYFNRVNSQGGINGRKINWIVEDDAYKPAQSLAAAKKLVERDNVFFIFGQMGASMIGAVAPYAERAMIPALGATAAPDPQREYVLTFMAPYQNMMYVATKYLLEQNKSKRIALLFQNDDFGELGRKGVLKAMAEAGQTLVSEVGYERGTTDFSTYVLKLRESQADAVLAMSLPSSLATAMKQAKSIGYKARWVAGAAGGFNSTQELLGADVEGLLYPSEIDSQYTESPAMSDVKELMNKFSPGAQIDWGTLLGYAQARYVVSLLKSLDNNLTREAVIKQAYSGKGIDVGIMPPVNYSSTKHSAATAARMFEWKDGKPVAVSDWVPF